MKNFLISTGIYKVAIAIKFLSDCFRLPLGKQHWNLYFTIHKMLFKELGSLPSLVSGQSFNEKIQWVKLFDQNPLMITCADKLGVREYVNEVLGEGYLPELFSVASDYDELNFQDLPDAFVIKANHDSGSVVVVKDKSEFDKEKHRNFFTNALSRPYGVKNGEWCYREIPRRLFIEEFIGDPSAKRIPADFKFHCSGGEVRFLQYIHDREKGGYEVIASPTGKKLDAHLDLNFAKSEEFEMPDQLKEMVQIANNLSKPFKYVRVDLFLENNRIYVGELTFFPYKGCYRGEGQKVLGQILDFDRSSTKPLISN